MEKKILRCYKRCILQTFGGPMLLRVLFTSLLSLFCICSNGISGQDTGFHSSIPVVDMNEFFDPATKQKFVDEVSKALQEVGFFAIINANTDPEAYQNGYQASFNFFNSPLELKDEIFDPELNGQRGYVHSEIAQGQSVKDFKEFLHIGLTGNIWPTWMDLKTPMENMIAAMQKPSEVLQRAFALAIGEEEEFFLPMTGVESLLRPIHYPANPAPNTFWAAKHTDIDLFTIIPMATEEGLQVFNNNEWIPVTVPPNSFIINGGDMLQNISNGLFKSSVHQVVAKPNVERYAIVYFIHPRNDDSLEPRPNSIAMTGGKKRFPKATRLELLAVRLRELGLASPALLQFEKDSGIMDRIAELVESGDAAEPVQLTYSLRNK